MFVVVMFMQKSYTWAPELDNEARKGFRKAVQKRLKGMAYDATARKNLGPPKWMSAELFDQMVKGREEEHFKTRSRNAAKNRRGGDLQRAVQPSHCQGSVSSAELAQRMVSNSVNYKYFTNF